MKLTRLIYLFFISLYFSAAWPEPFPNVTKNLPAIRAIRVNDVLIPAEKVESALQAARARGADDTPELRAAVRSQLIAWEVLRQEAFKEASPLERTENESILIQHYLKKALKPKPVSDQAVRAHYKKIIASLGKQEFKLRIMAIADESTARSLLAEIKAGAKFEDLAKQNSLDESRAAGGALDWISFKTPPREGKTQGLPLPLAEAALALPKGAITAEPIQWQNRYYLMQVDDVRPTTIPPYKSVQANLRKVLEEQALEKSSAVLMGKLIGAAHIE